MNINLKFTLITISLFLLYAINPLHAQGWDKYYGESLRKVLETEDNGNLSFGYSQNPNTEISEPFLLKTDLDGNEQWSRYYRDSTKIVRSIDFVITPDNGTLLLGDTRVPGFEVGEVVLIKTDSNGDIIWSKRNDYGFEYISPHNVFNTLYDGYLITATRHDSTNISQWLSKLSPAGDIEWSYTFPDNGMEISKFPPDVEILSDGYLLTGENLLVKLNISGEEIWTQQLEGNQSITDMIPVSDGNFMLMSNTFPGYKLSKRDAEGTEIWTTELNLQEEFPNKKIIETEDGGFLIPETKVNYISLPMGIEYITFGIKLIKLNSMGEEEWQKDVTEEGFQPYAAIKDSAGNLIFVGTKVEPDLINFEEEFEGFIIKADQFGSIYSNHITGNIFNDANLNCLLEEGQEKGLSNRLIKVEGNKTFYGTSDEMGNFNIPVDTGNYEVSLVVANPQWASCDTQVISLSEFYQDTILNFAAQPIIDCPWLTVDVSTPFLRRCFENNYTVRYCNEGTTTAEDAYIEVKFDPYLEVLSSSLMWSNQENNTFTFNVGTLEPNECGSFKINVLLDCDNTILGQTHCTEAHIFPDSICLPSSADWDGSSIVVEADCDIDSVRFQIKNIGIGNMQEVLEYIVIEDEIMIHQDDFSLNAGQSTVVPDGYSNGGSTYRIIAQQSKGHPTNSLPTAAIEGCGTTIFPIGFFNMFSQNDGNFYLSTDCQENIGAYDPNDKQAFPKGYGDEHYIWQNVDLDYKIRFQNTGTDTAFTVVVRDTISENLDITSLQMGASSHTYEYTIDEAGVLKATFNDILLPDSTTNQLGSNGFFKYKIQQQIDNPIGTMIYNEAAIYFDFNEPVITNETFLEIGEPFEPTTVYTDNLLSNHLKLTVFPNPFRDVTTFKFEEFPSGNVDFLLYDSVGRLVRKKRLISSEQQFQFHRKGLTAGLYFYEFHQDGVRVANGKMVAN